MKLLPKQEHVIYYLSDQETTEVLFGGAAGPGKSTVGVLWLIERCQKYPGTRWVMGRSKLKVLKETTLNTFFQQSAKCRVSNQFTFNAQDNVIRWHNGSEILLKDLFLYPADPEFDSLGSLEITGAFVDEVPQVSYKAWQVLISRIRYKLKDFAPDGTPTEDLDVVEYDEGDIPGSQVPVAWRMPDGTITRGLTPKCLGTCNPSKNWPYREFYRPWRDKELPKYRKFIPALPKDNPHLPQSYLDSLLRMEKNSCQRLYYGNWEYDDDPATLISVDAISNYFNPEHIKAEGNKYMTIDVARQGRDKTVIRIWHGWLCIKRVEFAKNTIPEVVDKIKALSREFVIPSSNIVADEDGVGGGVVDYAKCKGFVNNSTALNGENFQNLRSQCGIKMAEKIQNGEAGERCDDGKVKDRTTEEMEQVKLKDMDKDGKQSLVPKETIVKNIGRSPDDWDTIAMRYFFEYQKSRRVRIRV
jgi:phage terminase large subunit